MKSKWHLAIVLAVVGWGCGSSQSLVRYDDALDIRPERQFFYETAPCVCDETGSTRRDGRTLRGTVVEMVIRARRDSAGTVRNDTHFVFLSRCAPERRECLELIPLADVVLPAQQQGMVRNEYDNKNRVRSYNTVTGIPQIRDVPVRTVGCDCDPLDLQLGLRLPSWRLQCPERNCSWYFVELRAIPALFSYTDWVDRSISEERRSFAAEIAAGIRIGLTANMRRREGAKPCDEEPAIDEDYQLALRTDYCYRWGIGLAFTTGTRAYNMFSATPPEDFNRPVLALHVRYNFDRTVACMRPFVYGQIGTALDRLTMNLWRFSLRLDDEQERRIAELDSLIADCGIRLPGLNLVVPSYSLRMNASAPPLTFGIGAGVEIPLNAWMDLGIDLGYRSLGIGDELLYDGRSIPQGRRIGLWRLRVGLTF
ncbi:MAG: hypothetical protein NZ606_05480 [Candidatus Kapabacteria bacterium]|nr:hypothetical protein [Candidatus Kapabacteria bacterium]